MTSSSSRSWTGRTIARVALIVLCSFPSVVHSAQGTWPHLDEVHTILVEEEESLHSKLLSALGPSAAPAFWGVLSGQALLEQDFDLVAAGRAMRRGISSWDGDEVTERLLAELSPSTSVPERLVAVKLMSWTKSDAGLRGVFSTLAEVEPLQLRSRWVSLALDSALKELLSSDTEGFETLLELLPTMPRELLTPLTEAVGNLADTQVMLVLAKVAAQDPSLTRTVLSEVESYGHFVPPAAAVECIRIARESLRSRDKMTRRLGAQALARLADVASFEEIAWQLEDEDSGARRVALESLRTLSGLTRDWDKESWLSWFDAEEEWLDGAEQLASDLRGRDLYRAKVAVRELASHGLFGDSVSKLILPGLDHQNAGIRVATCEGLEQLGHTGSVPALIDALEDPNPKVRIAARVGLTRLTRMDHGEGAEAWDVWWNSR